MIQRVEHEIAGRKLILETGRVAELADGAVLARYGDTVVLAAVTSSREPREGVDFMPLTVDYEEKMYAAGKIPGGFIKREGRPTEAAILASRLTDRPLRPLFPKDYRNDIQVIVTVLSADQENDPAILSIIGASAALSISDIPFYGPVGAVKVGYIDGQLVLNPTLVELTEKSLLDLTVAGTADALLMVEAGAKELPEATILDALELAHRHIREIAALQDQLVALAGRPKRSYPTAPVDEAAEKAVREFLGDRLEQAIYTTDKAARETAVHDLLQEVLTTLGEQHNPKALAKAFDALEKEIVRRNILTKGQRPDGRSVAEIRPISCEVGVLPRTHGSALFTRGQTQVLSICTLGTVGDEQILDGLGIIESKRFMHHYNFPPYSTGEVRPLRGPSRRDIGHGALAERAIAAVIPSEEEFPYTIRIVSEVLSSNGSTSMGSVCGSTLALMDAGVPIKAPVAGVAMGLVTSEEGEYVILTDIQGVEDHLGDMDFKVAGTAEGITALQMDIKVRGITAEIMEAALAQAREGRLFILDKMLQALPAPRPELSPLAPRITKIHIDPDKIRDIIGPGGRTIRKITAETDTTIDIEDDGTVLIGSPDAEKAKRAVQIIEGLTRDIEVGGVYTGKVTRIMAFGAFVEILPGKEGLVHISELADYRVPRVEDVVNVGDTVQVVVTEIDRQGRINLSRRALLQPAEEEAPPERVPAGERRGPSRPSGGPERRGPGGPPSGGERRGPSGPGRGPSGPSSGERRGPAGPSRGPRPGPSGPGDRRGFGGRGNGARGLDDRRW